MNRPTDGDARLARAIAAIDAANADDPERIVVDGVERPKEQAHAEMMTNWVRRLTPGATDLQLIAARAHHLRRWSVPRSSYPEGRSGYLKWRTALRKQHGEEVASLLADVGYDQSEIDRVRSIVRKDGLARDPHVQTHEDALCLVFLTTQFDGLTERLGDEHMVDVVRKTLTKMSKEGIRQAVELPLSERGRAIVERASHPA